MSARAGSRSVHISLGWHQHLVEGQEGAFWLAHCSTWEALQRMLRLQGRESGTLQSPPMARNGLAPECQCPGASIRGLKLLWMLCAPSLHPH